MPQRSAARAQHPGIEMVVTPAAAVAVAVPEVVERCERCGNVLVQIGTLYWHEQPQGRCAVTSWPAKTIAARRQSVRGGFVSE